MSKLKFLYLAAIVLLSVASCTKVDSEIGSSYIPTEDQVGVRLDTLGSFSVHTTTVESVETSSFGELYCGSVVSPYFGQTSFSFISTLLPYSGLDVNNLWGTDPVIDSVELVLSFTSSWGNADKGQLITVKPLIKALDVNLDTLRAYSNFNTDGYLGDAIAQVSVSANETVYSKRVDNSIAQVLIDTTDGAYYSAETFFKRFPGLYFESQSFMSNGVYRALNSEYSGLLVHYHNFDEVPDTLTAFFSMVKSREYANVGFTMIDHDFSLAAPLIGMNQSIIDNKSDTCSVSYVVSQGGLMTSIDLKEEYFDALLEKVKNDGFSKIVVSNATLEVPLKDVSLIQLDTTANYLGLYYSYPTLEPIEDYADFISAQSYMQSHPFDGSLNRLKQKYSMDVTSYVQTLFTDQAKSYKIDLAPMLDLDMAANGAVIDSKNIRLLLTYYVIK